MGHHHVRDFEVEPASDRPSAKGSRSDAVGSEPARPAADVHPFDLVEP